MFESAGKIVAQVLRTMRDAVRPGITTGQLDDIASAELGRHGAIAITKDEPLVITA